MKIIFLTAGAAGMYCGSCMHDNALATALRRQGHDCILQPLYTPIRTDQPSVAEERLFFGGIHIYLLQRMPWLAKVPRPLRRGLDFPPLVRFLTRRSASVDAAQLGDLTISMLRGIEGRQSDEAVRLVAWLRQEQPAMIVWSNLLIAGIAPMIKRELPDAHQAVLLQGDDIFLDHLGEDHRREAIALMREKALAMDRRIVNSRYYAEHMAAILDIAPEAFDVHPLSIELSPRPDRATDGERVDGSNADQTAGANFDIGYMARIAPEKGLHILVDAFIALAGDVSHARLHIAGYLADHHREYLNSLLAALDAAGLPDRYVHHGTPTLEQKRSLLAGMDVVSVPTTYADPKGLFVLESLDAGTPVVQPDHGAFAELIESTGGGLLFPAGDAAELAASLTTLSRDAELRRRLIDQGRRGLIERHSIESAAERLTNF